jgi:hypothetical protein
MVQLEVLIGEDWTPVARYDTAHGFTHLDVLHPNRRQDKVLMRETDFNKALDIALTDLLENWEAYFSQYIKEM